MPSSSECHGAQERVLRAYDELTLALHAIDLHTLRSARKLVLDCYWTINELRLQSVGNVICEAGEEDGAC